MAKAMRRLLFVSALGGLLLCAGIVALFLAAWAVAAAGSGTAAGNLFAVGLAVLLPTSFLVAGGLVPGPPRPIWPAGSCPDCDAALPVGGGPRADRACMARPPAAGRPRGKPSFKSGRWDDELV